MISAGAPPQTALRKVSTPPDPLAGLKGSYFYGKGKGKTKMGRGKKEKRKQKGEKKVEGRSG